jgi:hypothetical protein
LAWVHDGGDRSEFAYAKEAVMTQEKTAAGAYPTAIVFYGGGADSLFPSEDEKDDLTVRAVLSRMVWLRERNLSIVSFSSDAGLRLNFEGFLLRASEWFPSLGPTELSMLCDFPRSSKELKPATIKHTASPILRAIEKNLLPGVRGDRRSRELFLLKAPTVIKEIDKVRAMLGRVDGDEVAPDSLDALGSDFLALRGIVERLSFAKAWNEVRAEETSRLLQSLDLELRSLG